MVQTIQDRSRGTIPLKNISIALPDSFLASIEALIKAGYVENRSCCVRDALDAFIKEEDQFNNQLKPEKLAHLINQHQILTEGYRCKS